MRGALRHLLCRVVACVLACWRRCAIALRAGATGACSSMASAPGRTPGRKPPTGCRAGCGSPRSAREVSWWTSLESQASEMQASFGGLPNSTIAVGHSLGGLVARQWSRSHELDGLITLGAPNRGAPIANHINEWAGSTPRCSTRSATSSTGLASLSYDQWWWVYSAVEGALNWGGFIAELLVRSPARRDGDAVRRAVRAGGVRRLAVPRCAQQRHWLGSSEHPVTRRHRQHGERVLAGRAVPAEEPRLRG